MPPAEMPSSVAVILPVRNGMPYLREAIQGILAQRYFALEIVVIDDGSTDGSAEFAQTVPGCRVLTTDGIGPAGARNAGIRATHSDLILFLDADDLAAPDSLHLLVGSLQLAPEAGLAQGYIQKFTTGADHGNVVFTKPYRFINLGSALWKRSVFNEVGLLDESLRLGEDQDLFMRCWERDILKVLVPSVTLHYRRHAGNMTRGLQGAEFGLMRVYRNRIERIRRGEYDPKIPRRVSWAEYLGASLDADL